MTGLTIDDYPDFFEAVTGFSPFKWQVDLSAQVHSERRWPDVCDLPTGSGKTSMLDLALFLLALDSTEPPERRWAPRRIVMVVDRRVVVDQAASHAGLLQRSLGDPGQPVVREVSDRLQSLSSAENGRAIEVGVLRGGLTIDEAWAARPDTPALLASTVDQIGSRLLFQGYGLSRSMRPIHAGLLSNDTIIFLDEVHLSMPFAQTLRAISARYQEWAEQPTPAPWFVCELSATPEPGPASWTFRLDLDSPAELEQQGPVLNQRLTASKPVRLQFEKVAKDATKARHDLVQPAIEAVRELLAADHVHRLAVVLNRVDTARAVARQLTNSEEFDTVLLTGRMRSYDRDPLVLELADFLRTRLSLDEVPDRKLVVVATQCIEAGADFDFDGMVTECASLDALRQRFGRVDRGGAMAAAGAPSTSVILGPSASIAPGANDPIYGQALADTWAWLETVADNHTVDFGITAFRPPDHGLSTQKPDAPLLLPAHLDAWVATPLARSEATPDVTAWLHGTDEVPADVQVVWRAELVERLLAEAASETEAGNATRLLRNIASLSPPTTGETVAVPIAAVRAWLADRPAVSVADVEGAGDSDEEAPRRRDQPSGEPLPFAIWERDQTAAHTDTRKLRPGATILVPSSYGGLATSSYRGHTAGTWDPTDSCAVTDVSDEAQGSARGRVVKRLLPVGLDGVRADLADRTSLDSPPSPATRPDDQSAEEHLADWLEHHPKFGHRPLVREFNLSSIGEPLSWYVVEHRPLKRASTPALATTDPDTSAFSGAFEATLDNHLNGVGAIAKQFAAHCRLQSELIDDLELAGQLHDVGKVDPRFQAWLRGGHPPTPDESLLAKSVTEGFDRQARERQRELAKYPQGMRHELLSLAMVRQVNTLASRAHDWDLVQHLVASHHGWCRPFAPAISDDDPQQVSMAWLGEVLTGSTDHGLERIDSGVSDRYWLLLRRYGWFRLTWFEAILRLADHRQSEFEQERASA